MADTVRAAGEAAYRRLDAMLDAMGFADPNQRAAKRSALLAELGLDERSPLARYLDGYAARVDERLARNTAIGHLDAAARSRLTADLSADLLDHLNRRFPASAPGGQPSPIEVLARLLANNDPSNNGIRNLVREVLRQHRSGRLTDATATDALTALDQLIAQYRDPLGRSADALKILQTAGPAAPGELRKLEAAFVKAGIEAAPPGAPAGTATVRYRPESNLTGTGLHGVGWSEADARARSTRQQAEDQRTGRVRPGPYDQGKFGTLADVWYAVQCARQQLGPQGNALGLPFEGAFRLPARHNDLVYRPGVSTPIVPDVVYVGVGPDGTIHAYPADSAVLSTTGLGAIRPAVTW